VLNATFRVSKMKQMLAKQLPDLSNEQDIDKIDFQDFKYVVGDTVTLISRKAEEGHQWRVNAVLDEMISLQLLELD
jgi:hypothetical protein